MNIINGIFTGNIEVACDESQGNDKNLRERMDGVVAEEALEKREETIKETEMRTKIEIVKRLLELNKLSLDDITVGTRLYY